MLHSNSIYFVTIWLSPLNCPNYTGASNLTKFLNESLARVPAAYGTVSRRGAYAPENILVPPFTTRVRIMFQTNLSPNEPLARV